MVIVPVYPLRLYLLIRVSFNISFFTHVYLHVVLVQGLSFTFIIHVSLHFVVYR